MASGPLDSLCRVGWLARASLRASTLPIVLFSAASVAQAAPCPKNDAVLLGSWQRTGSVGFFEQMALSRDGDQRVFDSWLHERPDVAGGSWSFASCTVRIASSGSSPLAFSYGVALRGHNRLELKEAQQPVAVYRRMRQP